MSLLTPAFSLWGLASFPGALPSYMSEYSSSADCPKQFLLVQVNGSLASLRAFSLDGQFHSECLNVPEGAAGAPADRARVRVFRDARLHVNLSRSEVGVYHVRIWVNNVRRMKRAKCGLQ